MGSKQGGRKEEQLINPDELETFFRSKKKKTESLSLEKK